MKSDAAGDGVSAARKPRRTARRARREEAAKGAIGAHESRLDLASLPVGAAAIADHIAADGGTLLATLRDPLAGRPLFLATLPLDRVEPTPYQRDVSPTHVERLADAITRTGLYLDPIIAFRDDKTGRYHTPNGGHRTEAMRRIGARAITALVIPDERIAYRILALNTEKAHNLRERSFEVVRMARALAPLGGREDEAAPYFEDPALLTLGVAYEKRPRFSGGAWHPIVRRIDRFLDAPLAETLPLRERRADDLLALDDRVSEIVDALKARGLQSPYLRNFVVSRINPLRFARAAPKKTTNTDNPENSDNAAAEKEATPDWDATLAKLRRAAEKFDPERIGQNDLARAGGAPPDAADEA